LPSSTRHPPTIGQMGNRDLGRRDARNAGREVGKKPKERRKSKTKPKKGGGGKKEKKR